MSSKVNREKECPFLLRVFYRSNGHNPMSQYTLDSVPTDELSLYTWKDATLEELARLIEHVVPEARDPDARVAFRLIYLDAERARYASREIGRVVAINPTEDQKKTLEDLKFFIGDYLDVAIYVGPPPTALQKGRAFTRDSRRPPPGRLNDRIGRRPYPPPPSRYDNNSRYNDRFGGGRGPARRGDRF